MIPKEFIANINVNETISACAHMSLQVFLVKNNFYFWSTQIMSNNYKFKRNKYKKIYIQGKKLNIERIAEIKENYEKLKSISKVAQVSGVDFKTAKKYICAEDEEKQDDIPKDKFIDNFLLTIIKAHPTIHQNEIRFILKDCFKIERSQSTISRWIARLGFKRKRVTKRES